MMKRLHRVVSPLKTSRSAALPASAPAPPPPIPLPGYPRFAAASKLGVAHGLGAYLGMCSYHASGQGPARTEPESAYVLAYQALYSARSLASDRAHYRLPLDFTAIDRVLSDFLASVGLHIIYKDLLDIRATLEREIRALSVHAGAAYNLGLLAGIAEGQASAFNADDADVRRDIIKGEMAESLQLAHYLSSGRINVNALQAERIRRGAVERKPLETLYKMCVDLVNDNQSILNSTASPT